MIHTKKREILLKKFFFGLGSVNMGSVFSNKVKLVKIAVKSR